MIIQHLRNIPPLEERGLYYQLYRGYVAALSTRELCTFIESHFTFTKLERKLLLDRLAKDVSHKCTKEHENLFTKLLDVADQQESYLQKMYYAKFIEALLPHVSKELQGMAVDFFLKSEYVYNRRRAYTFLETNDLNEFHKQLVKNWRELQDHEILPVFLKTFSSSRLTEIFDSIWEYYGESEWLDYREMIVRNRLVAKTAQCTMVYMDCLRQSDPVSFIFAMKENGQPVDNDFALEVFYKERKGFLLAWFGEMHMDDVLAEIQKDEAIFADGS